jgi:hypothetical protein
VIGEETTVHRDLKERSSDRTCSIVAMLARAFHSPGRCELDERAALNSRCDRGRVEVVAWGRGARPRRRAALLWQEGFGREEPWVGAKQVMCVDAKNAGWAPRGMSYCMPLVRR